MTALVPLILLSGMVANIALPQVAADHIIVCRETSKTEMVCLARGEGDQAIVIGLKENPQPKREKL